MATRHQLALALTGVMLVFCLSAAYAGDNRSVWYWWVYDSPWQTDNPSSYETMNRITDSSDTHYHGAGTETYPGTFTNGDALSDIRVEWAGYRNTNEFGWYEYTGDSWGTGNITHYPIFTGSDDAGTTWSNVLGWNDGSEWDTRGGTHGWYRDGDMRVHPERWGFYLYVPDESGDPYWYSEWSLNTEGGAYTNWYDQRHVEIFDDPRAGHPYGYVLCWEDLAHSGWHGHDARDFEDYDANTNDPQYSWGQGHTWDGGSSSSASEEPDYQDMILTFELYDYEGPYDDSPELGTWALLLATAAFGGWLKRRRKED